jgi:hypothetical protein
MTMKGISDGEKNKEEEDRTSKITQRGDIDNTTDQLASMHHHMRQYTSTIEGANTTQVLDVLAEDCEPFTIQLTDTNRVDTLHRPGLPQELI